MSEDSSILQSVIDLSIDRCDIVSAVGSVDVKGLVAELNIYEDMFSNCMSGNLLINDSNSLHNAYSWCGDEYLILSISRPGNRTSINKIFRVYSISDKRTTNINNENYVLNFCSEELFLSQRIRVSKTYKNMRISDMVKDIAIGYLKIDPKEFPDENIEPSFGSYNITIPNLKPLQAINWLSTLAISDKLPKNKQSGATYVFWQTADGYYFKSALGILNDMKLYSGFSQNGFYWYGAKNAGLSNLLGVSETQLDDREQILSYKNMNSFDSLQNARKSMFTNKLITLDYLTRTYEENVFDYEKYFNDYLKPNIQTYKGENNSEPALSDATDRFNKKHNEYPDVVIKIAPTTTNQIKNQFIKKNQPDILDYNIEYTIPYRVAQFALLSLNRFKLVIPGDPNIRAGYMIEVKMPQTSVSEEEQNMDRFMSGKYLVTCVRHMMNVGNVYETILEIRKDSYDSSTINTNSKIKGLASFSSTTGLDPLKKQNSF